MRFAITGTDARFPLLRKLLLADGHEITDPAFADMVVPPPWDPSARYARREEYQIANARLTAEGAVALLRPETGLSGAHVLPTAKNNKKAVARAWEEAQENLAHVLPDDFPLPARYAHPVVLTRMIRILREGRAQSKEEALDVLKADLRALTADVQVEQEEHDEVVVIKPLFLVSDYQ